MRWMLVAVLVLGARAADADMASRIADARAAHAATEARDYNYSATGLFLNAQLRSCAPPPGTALPPEAAAFSLIASVAADGTTSEVEVEPASAFANCLADRLRQAVLPKPPAGLAGGTGFPLLIELKRSDGARTGTRRGAITPVFSQLVAFTIPEGFVHAFENANADNLIMEFVPAGETVQDWKQMVTLTGSKDAARIPQSTAVKLAQSMATELQLRCPQSFAAKPLGRIDANGHEGFAALMGCGSVEARPGQQHGETFLLVAIKGAADFYTIQWAERSTPVATAPAMDDSKWLPRLRQLLPLRVCNRVAGEAPPFPSCVEPAGAPPAAPPAATP